MAGQVPGLLRLPLGEHSIEYAGALMELRLLPEAADGAGGRAGIFRSRGPVMAAEAQLRVAQLALLTGDHAAAARRRRRCRCAFGQRGPAAVATRGLSGRGGNAADSGAGHRHPCRPGRGRARRLNRMADLGAISAAVQGFLVAGRLRGLGPAPTGGRGLPVQVPWPAERPVLVGSGVISPLLFPLACVTVTARPWLPVGVA